MRYLIVTPYLSKGSGLTNYVCTLASIVSNAGNMVAILTTHARNSREEAEVLEIAELSDVKLVSLECRNKIATYFKAWRSIRRFAPDVIVNNYDGALQFLLPFLSRKIKEVHVVHNNVPDFYRIAAINGSRVDGWIAPAPGVATDFDKYTNGRYRNRITVIPHGVRDAKELQQKKNRAELSFVGTLYEHKGALLLPDIIKQLNSRNFDFHFTIVGEGPCGDEMRRLLAEEVNNGTVTFAGVIPPEEVYDVLSATDIFVYPTRIDAFGLVIAEAMANGAAPVVSRIAGVTDFVVQEGVSGVVLDKRDAEAFADAIELLLSDRKRLNIMQEAAKQRVSEKFSMAAMAKGYTDYFKNLLNNNFRL